MSIPNYGVGRLPQALAPPPCRCRRIALTTQIMFRLSYRGARRRGRFQQLWGNRGRPPNFYRNGITKRTARETFAWILLHNHYSDKAMEIFESIQRVPLDIWLDIMNWKRGFEQNDRTALSQLKIYERIFRRQFPRYVF